MIRAAMIDVHPSLLDRPARNWIAYRVEKERQEQRDRQERGDGDIQVLGDSHDGPHP